MFIKRVALGVAATALLAAQVAHADLVPFTTNTSSGGTTSGANYTLATMETISGVSFTATLKVTALGGDVTQNSVGLGVAGNGSGSVQNGQGLFFAMEISDVSGGTVTFDGFNDITVAAASGSGALSHDFSISTTGDNFFDFTVASGSTFTADISSTSPETFFALTAPRTGGVPSLFRVGGVTGSFSVAAVPEPTAFLFGSLVAGSVGMVVARRRPTRKPQTDAA